MDEHPKQTYFAFEAKLQPANQWIANIRSELKQMLRHAKERSEIGGKRVMASMGLFHNLRMFIRHRH